MEEYLLIGDTTLTDIANAIRSKTGGNNKILVDDMADCIKSSNLLIDYVNTKATDRTETYQFYNADYFNSVAYTVIKQLSQRTFACDATVSSNLTSVNFPEVTNLSEAVFSNCKQLKTVSIPKASSIGEYCFENCESLTCIELPGMDNSNDDYCFINDYAFLNCKQLKSVVLPNTKYNIYIVIDEHTFDGTPIANGEGYIYVPDDAVAGFTEGYYGDRYLFKPLSEYTGG